MRLYSNIARTGHLVGLRRLLDGPLFSRPTQYNWTLAMHLTRSPLHLVLLRGRTGMLERRLRTPVNNVEYFPPNFEGLVLGCIDADFCK